MGRGTKTTEFLKDCMADALLKLMRDTPVSKITAQDITTAAGVGRVTWFRNFNSKEDAIAYKVLGLWKQWLENHDLVDRNLSLTENAKLFFDFNYSIRDILTTIYKENMQISLYNAYYEIIMPTQCTDAFTRYSGLFYAYGIVGLLDEWVRRKFQETPEEMTTLAIEKHPANNE